MVCRPHYTKTLMKHTIDPTSPTALYQWATARCAQKEYCASEISQKLRQRGASFDDIESLIARLEEEGYIDEERYARAFTRDKYRFDHWGRVKITYALRQKGITSSAISHALDEIDEADYEANLRAFLHSRLRQTKAPTPQAARQKVIRAAVTRGYEIERVIDVLGAEPF